MNEDMRFIVKTKEYIRKKVSINAFYLSYAENKLNFRPSLKSVNLISRMDQ